jgi:hypothetical protein
MSEALVKRGEMDNATLTAVVTDGDCSRLNEQQRREYYLARCEAAGLDPRTAPFMFTKLNGKLVLYALKAATDQLASNNRVATTILQRETIEGVYCVTVRATAADGRSTEDMGAVQIGSLKGEALANALMKAVTKAKRRAVLSLCGLGMLDESEVQDIQREASPRPVVRGVVHDNEPTAALPPHDPVTGEVQEPTSEQSSLFAGLMAALLEGFNAQPHKDNWAKKHAPEIKTLPEQMQNALREAFVKAHINSQEAA